MVLQWFGNLHLPHLSVNESLSDIGSSPNGHIGNTCPTNIVVNKGFDCLAAIFLYG